MLSGDAYTGSNYIFEELLIELKKSNSLKERELALKEQELEILQNQIDSDNLKPLPTMLPLR